MTTVAFLGPRGTFTEQAVLDFATAGHLPADADHVTVTSPAIALDMVRSGEADVACVALESSVDGPVTQTFDAFTVGSELQIVREHDVPVAFELLVRPGTALADVRTLTCHPVAYNQTTTWRAATLPDVTFVAASSNGAGAAAVAAGEVDAAPLVQRDSRPCDWCDYRTVCRHVNGRRERALSAPAKVFEEEVTQHAAVDSRAEDRN